MSAVLGNIGMVSPCQKEVRGNAAKGIALDDRMFLSVLRVLRCFQYDAEDVGHLRLV